MKSNPSHRSRRLIPAAIAAAAAATATELPPAATVGAYDEMAIAVIETRPCDASCRAPDNPCGWIETRPGDNAATAATVDTLTPIGVTIYFR